MTSGNRVFSEDQREVLTAVLNRIIPAQDNRAGAGDLGVAAFVEKAAGRTPGQTRLFNEGLNELQVTGARSQPDGFLAMPDQAKDDILRGIEAAKPEFFDQLVKQAYNGYYTDSRTFESIGYRQPGVPVEGAQPPLLDEALLEQQKQRPPFWTKT